VLHRALLEALHMAASRFLATVNETSIHYRGWWVVLICFAMAAFAWALGFYGQGVYLAELHRAYGWPSSSIATATTFYYLFSAFLVVFVSDAIRLLGVRMFLCIAVGCMALATLLFGLIDAPWQLYGVYALMAVGWAGLTMAAISNAIGLWFDTRRALAISLALNGASFGGVVGVPLLVAVINAVGFTSAVVTMAVVMMGVLLPVILLGMGHPPYLEHPLASARGGEAAPSTLSPAQARSMALHSLSFWTITVPFALALLAQIGFIMHQISFMMPMIGRERASLVVSLMTAMAVVGRVLLGFMIDRLNQRLISAVLFISQALALLAMVTFSSEAALFISSAVFGFAVGNAITMPSVIIHREFSHGAFGAVVSLSTAISSAISACGPAVVGVLRDLSNSYAPALYVCMGMEIAAAAGVLIGGRSRA
jgi:MFS family permease